ncbi:hypothetical protein [Methylobacterium adhaesivum]|uniref:Uncharacterized protein n=1 Tax=Methylobacterium adhaesivum TaxID=333297 RepID=A0ABT8BBM1_9HYPH|nr:hypothetical protein [Methylobacterium adhaesivum]MDN3589195.1 hypothetical protein [Methylobacterium adhaesivum]
MKCHADRLVWRPAAIDHAQSDEGAPIPQASALDKRAAAGNRGFVEFQFLETDVPDPDIHNTDEA